MRKVCPTVGCPVLINKDQRACPDHRRAHERARGTRQQRGYDAEHDALRAQWAPLVAAGGVACWRCRHLIAPDADWHLGHDDHDRTQHRGPEHARCNLSAAGRVSHGLAPFEVAHPPQ